MRTVVRLAILAAWASVGVGRAEEIRTAPPMPSPAALPRALPAEDGPAGGKAAASKTKPGPPKITRGEAKDDGPHGLRGASQVLGREAEVKVKGPTLIARLTGTAAAYNAVACPGSALASIRLIQPFEVEPGKGAARWIRLNLTLRADGYVRTAPPATAGLRVASATVYPAGGGPGFSLALPPAAVADGGHFRYQQAASAAPVVLPAGAYVLVLDLAAAADAAGHFHGEAEAVFSPSLTRAEWPDAVNPYKDVSAKDFGLTAVLKAESIAAESDD